jgi:hypothetical protein
VGTLAMVSVEPLIIKPVCPDKEGKMDEKVDKQKIKNILEFSETMDFSAPYRALSPMHEAWLDRKTNQLTDYFLSLTSEKDKLIESKDRIIDGYIDNRRELEKEIKELKRAKRDPFTGIQG